ncbi:D-amino acid dehydrogenase [Sinorhizobium saheli]|uniref:Amino acid dehydrogenase n=1 Tax=Sinorhizobium saheli TaxID=36856 RepID=A0A178Y8T3_SINSA|nr:D-amino acid dehydrogenase [Sinorhizobium saheli]MQW87898.1 FAD-dependent oxidoreductase [Sinorhizobium saheli]OAP43095.1 amino acid dehydrogenase [Sinorhizobium saheli]
MSDVFVLGAGVVGMTTAYVLASRGHKVTVIDAGSAPAERGASFGNGAQLSYAFSDPLASPSLVANLPKYLFGRDPAFRLTPTMSPKFWGWSLRFLANSSRSSFERNTIEVLKLAMESRRAFSNLSGRFNFDHRSAGKLNLYSNHMALRNAEALSQLKNRYGADQKILTPNEAIEREPALAGYGHAFVGALWSPIDEAGDSWLFCQNLHRLLQSDYGVKFRFDTEIKSLKTRDGKINAIVTSAGELECGRAVIALGVWSAAIARSVGIKLPIWPMQGYSLTVPATSMAPSSSITDTTRKVVFCKIGDRLRIAGLADIGNSRTNFREARFQTLLETARGIFPDAGDYNADLNAWTGLRPMTPNNQPIVGACKVAGLFLNCGHGSLGWTLCMATAQRLAAVID